MDFARGWGEGGETKKRETESKPKKTIGSFLHFPSHELKSCRHGSDQEAHELVALLVQAL